MNFHLKFARIINCYKIRWALNPSRCLVVLATESKVVWRTQRRLTSPLPRVCARWGSSGNLRLFFGNMKFTSSVGHDAANHSLRPLHPFPSASTWLNLIYSSPIPRSSALGGRDRSLPICSCSTLVHSTVPNLPSLGPWRCPSYLSSVILSLTSLSCSVLSTITFILTKFFFLLWMVS